MRFEYWLDSRDWFRTLAASFLDCWKSLCCLVLLSVFHWISALFPSSQPLEGSCVRVCKSLGCLGGLFLNSLPCPEPSVAGNLESSDGFLPTHLPSPFWQVAALYFREAHAPHQGNLFQLFCPASSFQCATYAF